MARVDLWTAVRGAIVLLLMGSLVSGFSLPGGNTLAQMVPGTPTVGITGGVPATGTQITGEIVGIDTIQVPPIVMLQTTAGQTYILVGDPAAVPFLGLGLTVTFVGNYLTADVFSAFLMLSNTTASGSGELTLGDPLTSNTTTSDSGSTTTTTSSSGNTTSSTSGSSIVICDSSDNDNADEFTPSGCVTATPTVTRTPTRTPTVTRTPTQTTCMNNQTLAINPSTGNAVTGTPYNVVVTVSNSGACTGQKVYLKVTAGPNVAMVPVFATIGSSNTATLSYTSTLVGTDAITVWMEFLADGLAGTGEPTANGFVNWAAPTPTPTATATKTPAARVANTATRTPTATPRP